MPLASVRFPHPPLLQATSPKPSPSSKLILPLSFRLKLKIRMIFQITLLTKTLFKFPFLTFASFIQSVLDQIKVHACFVLFTICTLKKELVSECIFFRNLYWVLSLSLILYLCTSHTNEVLFPTSHNAPCLPRPKFCIIFNFSQDYCSTHEKKLRRNLSGNWVIWIFSGLKIKITQLPGRFRLENKGYVKLWGANKVYLLWEMCKNSSFVHHQRF